MLQDADAIRLSVLPPGTNRILLYHLSGNATLTEGIEGHEPLKPKVVVLDFPQEAADHHQDPRLHLRRHGDLQERPQPLLSRRLVRALPAQQELKLLLLQISLEVDGHFIHVAGRWIFF